MVSKIFYSFIIFVACVFASSANWIIRKFGNITYEQIIFHLNVPLEAETNLIESFVKNVVLFSFAIAILMYFVFYKIGKKKSIILSLCFFVASMGYFYYKVDVKGIFHDYQRRLVFGHFYEDHYVDPHEIKLAAPVAKRNLIMIFAESMESTYSKEDYWGDNLIPELTELARENINFSDDSDVGGFYNLEGAHFTQASLAAQLCAIPLRLPIKSSHFRPANGFLKGAICLSDILKSDGYNQSFMIGMSRKYAGTDKFFESHANVKILDLDYYLERYDLWNKLGYKTRRTIRDFDLFNFAKGELLELSAKPEPFAFSMMTMDTHFGTEHFESRNCAIKYHDNSVDDKENFKNVYSCADKQISEFIKWIKKQPFYENTLIVVVGDHPTMGFDEIAAGKKRRVFDLYINSVISDRQFIKQRDFTALDTLPTLLEAIGYVVPNHKFGLGVSLFSGEKTLLEEIGDVEVFSNELNMQSAVYNKIF